MRLPSRRRSPAGRARGTGRTTGRRPEPVTGKRRTTSRPAQQRRQPAAPGARQPAPAAGRTQPRRAQGAGARRSGRLTTRAVVLGLAICALVLTLAYPTRNYVAQHNQIAHLEAQQRAQRGDVAALERRKRQWNDPAFVKAQARQRLQYVMPGEVGYVVLDPARSRADRPAGRLVTVPPPGSARGGPWYSQLWGTVRAADSAR